MRHYRACRERIGGGGTKIDCQDPSERVTDSATAEWSMNILDHVERVRKRLFSQITNDQR